MSLTRLRCRVDCLLAGQYNHWAPEYTICPTMTLLVWGLCCRGATGPQVQTFSAHAQRDLQGFIRMDLCTILCRSPEL